jgi:hypothetical protein
MGFSSGVRGPFRSRNVGVLRARRGLEAALRSALPKRVSMRFRRPAPAHRMDSVVEVPARVQESGANRTTGQAGRWETKQPTRRMLRPWFGQLLMFYFPCFIT